LKAGSVFKSGQYAYNKAYPRKRLVNADWAPAVLDVKNLWGRQKLVPQDSSKGLWRLKSDFSCKSLEIATLIVTGMDYDASIGIWTEAE